MSLETHVFSSNSDTISERYPRPSIERNTSRNHDTPKIEGRLTFDFHTAVHDRHREVRFTDGIARRAPTVPKVEVDEGPAAPDDLDLAAQRLEERGRPHRRPGYIILVLESGFRLELGHLES